MGDIWFKFLKSFCVLCARLYEG